MTSFGESPWFAVILLVIAALYAAVGQAGATGYLAAMGVVGLETTVMKPTALALNLAVASIATIQFWRAGLFSWSTFYPFAVLGFPFSLVGGAVHLSRDVYYPLVGAVLLLAAVQLLRAALRTNAAEAPEPPVVPPFLPALLTGAVIGFVSGTTGTGGGISVGTIFSVVEAPADISGRDPTEADFLLPGRRQVAAGYALYGPQTLLVLSVGTGVHEFSLDRTMGAWELTGENLRIPSGSREFAINMSNRRHWSEPVRRYIDDCMAGKDGPLGHDYGMRWTGSMAADIHRILKRGGVFMYPWDSGNPNAAGKLRLMYEANPMGFLIEQAGGLAMEEDHPILEIEPHALHQRVGVTMGDRDEVERILSYFASSEDS